MSTPYPTKMGGGTSIRSQPANFARESSPASRLVKILLKDYIQYKRAIDEGSSEKGDTHTQAKPSQNPRKPQYSQRRRSRGRKEREDTHSSKKLRAQYSQQRRPRETHSNHTKKDRNEKSHQRPYRYGHWFPIGVGKNGDCAETENV